MKDTIMRVKALPLFMYPLIHTCQYDDPFIQTLIQAPTLLSDGIKNNGFTILPIDEHDDGSRLVFTVNHDPELLKILHLILIGTATPCGYIPKSYNGSPVSISNDNELFRMEIEDITRGETTVTTKPISYFNARLVSFDVIRDTISTDRRTIELTFNCGEQHDLGRDVHDGQK